MRTYALNTTRKHHVSLQLDFLFDESIFPMKDYKNYDRLVTEYISLEIIQILYLLLLHNCWFACIFEYV